MKGRRKSRRHCWGSTWLYSLQLTLRSPRTVCSLSSPSATHILVSRRTCSFPHWQSLVGCLLEARSCLILTDTPDSALITFGDGRGSPAFTESQCTRNPWPPSERGKTVLVGLGINRETRACFPGPRSGFVVGPHQDVPRVAGER